MRRRLGILAGVLLALVAIALTAWVQFSATGRAAYNVVEYRVQRRLPVGALGARGALAGRITTSDGRPLGSALALVSTGRGLVFQDVADDDGVYRIENVPAGSYVPVADAWGYDSQPYRGGRKVGVRANGTVEGVDFELVAQPAYQPEIGNLTIGETETVSGTFPAAITARRSSITFEHAGLRLENSLLYEPPGDEPLPALLLALPTPAIGWERISVALANEGYVVLATAPDMERGLDLEAHVRDLVAVGQLLLSGELTSRADTTRVAGLDGSFSSILLFRALRDLPPFRGVVTMGGISDGFLGYQALFRQEAQVPPPYDSFIASLGRPDRHPEIYLTYSPAFFPQHLPPTLIIHTEADAIIPPDQATRLAAAMQAAGTRHELVLYEDVSHYLDPENPTEETRRVFDVTVRFLGEVMSDE